MTGRDMICQLLKTKYKYSNIPHTLDHVLEIIAENMNVLDVWKEEQHLVELRDEIKQLERKLKVIKSSPKRSWILVKDRLPVEKINPITQDFELVICATTFGDVRAYGYGKVKGHDKAHFWHGAGIMDEYVTHWMPLPQKPESEDDADA